MYASSDYYILLNFCLNPTLQKLCSATRVVERAFGRLKQRWRCLLKRCDAGPHNAKIQIAACITLHNLCEIGMDFLDMPILEESPDETDVEFGNDESGDGARVRQALTTFLLGP